MNSTVHTEAGLAQKGKVKLTCTLSSQRRKEQEIIALSYLQRIDQYIGITAQ
jgi:hypothetical protein